MAFEASSVDTDFLKRLAEVRPTLSPQLARLASYVSEHYVQVAIMSTRELAEKAGVSLTTVVRLPGVLGFSNFDELRASIQARVNNQLNGVERLKAIPSSAASSISLLQRIIEQHTENLRALGQTFNEHDFEKFCQHLARAERIVVVGVRYVAPVAAYFGYSLNKIRPGVEVVTSTDSTAYDTLRLLDKSRDALLVLAFPRYPVELVKLVRYAEARGLTVLSITDSPLSPVIEFSKLTLYARTHMQDLVGSLAAPAALLDCLVARLGKHLGKKALERLEALEESARENSIYCSDSGSRSGA
ncbi:MAG TPA: MurR/RpiR family transcriptional regulator [Planctomycetota bacterium]|nr:MurR/RpiR family transcriptional regulator [Planctomycetota bacterium]